MKKLTLLFAFASCMQVMAQEAETFLGPGKVVSTGYGALTTQFSSLNSQNAVFTGGYGGWMINHKLMIGIGGYGLVSRQDGFTADGEVDEANKLHMGYGGLMLEYTFMQNKKIHMTSGLLIGGGAIENGYGADYSDSPGSNFHTVSESTFTAFQPSVNVEANMTNWFRVAVGGGYRLIHGSDIEGLTDKKLSAPSFGVTLKFGKF